MPRLAIGMDPIDARPRESAKAVLGDYGERLAERYLRERGVVILDRNWRWGRFGELDLVARDGGCLVGVEVKTRRGGGFVAPVEALSHAKVRRLRRLVAAWLAAHEPAGCDDVRIDLIGVHCSDTDPAQVEHVTGVG